MGNFKNQLARFMYGRYGIDPLYYVLFVISLILIIANNFIQSPIISGLILLIMIWVVFRMFSRNIYKRHRENERLMKLILPFKGSLSLTLRRIKEIKTHRFRKCPYCKKVLRLRRKTGKHGVKCPCCHKDFIVRIMV